MTDKEEELSAISVTISTATAQSTAKYDNVKVGGENSQQEYWAHKENEYEEEWPAQDD